MSSMMSRRDVAVLLAGAMLLLLPAGDAPAQGGCGQGQGRSRQGGMRMSSLMAQQYAFAQRYAMPQYTAQPYGLSVTLQQLQQQQQLAMLVALQQQPLNAVLAGQPQPQNAMLKAQPQPQQQQDPPAAQARPQPAPAEDVPAVKPLKPDEAAARQVSWARELLADARTAQVGGEANRAGKLRARAVARLRDVVATYPGTWGADKAEFLLDDLGER
jgi:hypothetical protein